MSPLLIADDWARHVCDQQVRGSNSCHFKCTMSWHLQLTRCTLDRRRASAWVGSSMSPLLIANDWSCHVCDQEARGSSSCHPKCQQNWHSDSRGVRSTEGERARAWAQITESTIDCGQLVTTRARPTSPRQQQLPVQVPKVGTYSSRGVRSADCERARGWAQVRSPLLFADDWTRHVCGQQVRGSSSCYSKCTMNWHLQFTRCTLG